MFNPKILNSLLEMFIIFSYKIIIQAYCMKTGNIRNVIEEEENERKEETYF